MMGYQGFAKHVRQWSAVFIALMVQLLCLAPASAQVVIDYTYDELNRLKTMTRDDGPAANYSYDVVSNHITNAVTNSPDTDGDQIANFVDLDDDGDQLPDTWELQYGLDPLNPADANSDTDGDGQTALQEFLAGTNPTVSDSSDDYDEDIPFLPPWALILLASLMAGMGSKFQKRRASVNTAT